MGRTVGKVGGIGVESNRWNGTFKARGVGNRVNANIRQRRPRHGVIKKLRQLSRSSMYQSLKAKYATPHAFSPEEVLNERL